MVKKFSAVVLAVCASVVTGAAQAQVVREVESVRSLARVLDGPYDEFVFYSSGGQILFADIDANIYQTAGRGKSHEEATAEAGGPPEGMGGGEEGGATETEHGGGCSGDEGGGGPTGFCLQVLDAAHNLLCHAGRPNYPGWQRDPALACVIPQAQMYYLRVLLSGPETGGCGSTDPGAYRDADALEVAKRFYMLSYSLRTMAPDGSVLMPAASTVTDSRSRRTR